MPKKRLAKKKLGATGDFTLESRHSHERGHSITYQSRLVLCGKPNCAKLHGPYWYAYWTAGGRVQTHYIGKSFQRLERKAPHRLKGNDNGKRSD